MTAQRYVDIKGLPAGLRRQAALRRYFKLHRRIATRVAARTGRTPSMVSKVMNGLRGSVEIERAIEAEERQAGREKKAA